MRSIWTAIFGLILALALAGAVWLYLDSQRVVRLTVAAGEKGSDSFTLMQEVSEVLERHSEYLRLSVVESRNASEGITLVENGEVELATIGSNTPAYANIKLVTELFPDYFLLITRDKNFPGAKDYVLNSIKDLPGKTVALPEAGKVGNLSFWSVIDHYRIPPESFSTFSGPHTAAVERFLEGRVDAIFFQRSLRDPLLLKFLEEADLRQIRVKFIPIEQAAAMSLKRPYLLPETIMKGSFNGRTPLPAEDLTVPSLNRLLVAGKDVDAKAINQFVTFIFSNRLDLLIRMPLSNNIRDPRNRGGAVLGLHEGAQQFYDRDEPSFLHENAEPMALLVTILAMTISAFVGLRSSMSSRAKNRADVYNVKILEIAKLARESDDIEALRQMKNDLSEILENAVRALDTNDVTDEGFQSFSLLWSSVRDTINERIQDLTKAA